MCSTPKGGSSKSRINSKLESLTSDMEYAEYADMVRRANESYEKRQQEIALRNKNHKQMPKIHKKVMPSCRLCISFIVESCKKIFFHSRPTIR